MRCERVVKANRWINADIWYVTKPSNNSWQGKARALTYVFLNILYIFDIKLGNHSDSHTSPSCQKKTKLWHIGMITLSNNEDISLTDCYIYCQHHYIIEASCYNVTKCFFNMQSTVPIGLQHFLDKVWFLAFYVNPFIKSTLRLTWKKAIIKNLLVLPLLPIPIPPSPRIAIISPSLQPVEYLTYTSQSMHMAAQGKLSLITSRCCLTLIKIFWVVWAGQLIHSTIVGT